MRTPHYSQPLPLLGEQMVIHRKNTTSDEKWQMMDRIFYLYEDK